MGEVTSHHHVKWENTLTAPRTWVRRVHDDFPCSGMAFTGRILYGAGAGGMSPISRQRTPHERLKKQQNAPRPSELVCCMNGVAYIMHHIKSRVRRVPSTCPEVKMKTSTSSRRERLKMGKTPLKPDAEPSGDGCDVMSSRVGKC